MTFAKLVETVVTAERIERFSGRNVQLAKPCARWDGPGHRPAFEMCVHR